MIGFKVLIFAALCLSWVHCKQDTYCSICENHTMCKFHGYGENCKDVGKGGVTDKEKRDIVDLHNWMRSLVASGYESRGIGGGQPKAANMMKFIWDDELQKVAQRWADQCRFEHDSCRNDPRWNVGQNIYWKWKYPTHKVNWTEAIFSWFDEVAEYDPIDVNKYRFISATGHYTQMIWHDTYAVGCGRRDYGLNKIYICNYGPAGNWIGEPLYQIGEPCTNCPQGTTCDGTLCALPSLRIDLNLDKALEIRKREPSPEDLGTRIGNETENHEEFKPSKDSYKGDNGKPKCNCTQEILNENTHGKQVLSGKVPELNELDVDLKKEIEDIKQKIDNLVKNIIKKIKTKH